MPKDRLTPFLRNVLDDDEIKLVRTQSWIAQFDLLRLLIGTDRGHDRVTVIQKYCKNMSRDKAGSTCRCLSAL